MGENGVALQKSPRKDKGRRKVYQHPRWDDIEDRLRLRWSPERVVRWLTKTHPGEPAPNERTLQRVIKEKPKEWFLDRVAIQEIVGPRLTRVLALEEGQALIEVLWGKIQELNARIVLAKQKEDTVGGFLLPETRAYYAEFRAYCDQLSRTLLDHFKIQQELGLEPSLRKGEGLPLESPLIGAMQVNQYFAEVLRAPQVRETMDTLAALMLSAGKPSAP